MVSAEGHSGGETFINSGTGLTTEGKTLSKLGSSQCLGKKKKRERDMRTGRGGDLGAGYRQVAEKQNEVISKWHLSELCRQNQGPCPFPPVVFAPA